MKKLMIAAVLLLSNCGYSAYILAENTEKNEQDMKSEEKCGCTSGQTKPDTTQPAPSQTKVDEEK